MTAVKLLLAGICMATFAIAYSMAHPSEEGTREVGSRPVRVVDEPTYETLRLGRAAELPPLTPRPPEPAPVQVQVERAEPPRNVAIDRPRPVARTSAPAAPPAPVTPDAPPTPSPDSVYEPPPPPPAPEPEAMTFDDSG